MGLLIYIYTIVTLLALEPLALGTTKEQLSSRECEDLGFTGLALCSYCNTLAEYVKDQRNPPTNSLFGYYFENLILWVFLDFENLILDFENLILDFSIFGYYIVVVVLKDCRRWAWAVLG
ncbi:selenoprotein F [Fagus crenata]